MRDEAPVYYSERWDFYALTRNEDVVAAHRDWETFSSAYGVTLDGLSMRQRFERTNMLILMDPPEHERLRKLVRQVFTKAAIANLEPLVAEVVTAYVDALEGKTDFDLVADFAALVPGRNHLLDARRPRRRAPADPALDRRIPAPRGNNPFATESGVADSMAMSAYFLELSAETPPPRRPDHQQAGHRDLRG